ncbi:MAG: hypothetical protein H7Y31_10965 [Chitinophagaceae bacterium]|nr:hypothetical protein [Chitinophagaceae bacterium]
MPSLGQNIGINTDRRQPHGSAILVIKSSTEVILIPGTSSRTRTSISNPAKGLMHYNSTTSSWWFYNGAATTQIVVGSNPWSLSGNAGTVNSIGKSTFEINHS